MEYKIKNHRSCIACSDKGFLFRGFQYSDAGSSIEGRLSFKDHTEGWVGLPHGGIGMGAIMELVYGLNGYPDNDSDAFPLQLQFRMGGQKVKIGDEAVVKVTEQDSGAQGSIFVEADQHPYLQAGISYKQDPQEDLSEILSSLPAGIVDNDVENMLLPRYKDCFVCGYERSYPGLDRVFHLLGSGEDTFVYARTGFDPGDQKSFYWFKKNEYIHPVALLALLDETMGWAGFFISGHGGVTVKLKASFIRDIGADERLIVFGRPEKKSGKSPRLMFFWSTGGIASVRDDGSFEIVAVSDAQYLVQSELTDQMKEYLYPKELTEKVFSLV